MRAALVAYVPVLHNGYMGLLQSSDVRMIYLLSRNLLEDLPEEFDYLRRKDSIRAMPEKEMVRAVRTILYDKVAVRLAGAVHLHSIPKLYDKVIMPDEDVSREIARIYFGGMEVEYISVFLRFDRNAVLKEEAASFEAHRRAELSELDRIFMGRAEEEAEKSADWWRQVGAVLVKDDVLLFAARNDHTPFPQAPNAFGDPRSIFKRGVSIECSTAEHAEAALIAEAAKRGVSTEGASLYVTMFPCPQCARLVAHAGIKRCYFARGYAVLDGGDEMRRHNVELIHAKI